MDKNVAPVLPLHITQALLACEKACAGNGSEGCHDAVMRLADAIIYYVGAVAVAQYSQGLYTGQIEADPTLNRSLRSLRRILPGQWLVWATRGLENTPEGPVLGMREWYSEERGGAVAAAYEALRRVMVEQMDYTGEYGPRDSIAPRTLLEMVDQHRIRSAKHRVESTEDDPSHSVALLAGLREIIGEAKFMSEYSLYAPQQRQLLMGAKATTPMPPISAPGDVAAAATILLYPPGEVPDYTKRPNLQAERVPLFPLDPLLAYLYCSQCDRYVVSALREVARETPTYVGLDPRCTHEIRVEVET